MKTDGSRDEVREWAGEFLDEVLEREATEEEINSLLYKLKEGGTWDEPEYSED